MLDLLRTVVGSTGWLGTLFSVTAMVAATGMWCWRPETFTSANWLHALSVCAGLVAAVIGKRALDNTKLAKPGVGDRGA
jgi:hypothetical protein